MSTMCLAMWLQDSDPSGTRHLILIFIIVIAVAIAALAVAMMLVGLKALKVINELGTTAVEVKLKFLPLMDEVMAISKASREMLEDAAPKIKTISENLVKTSETLVETSRIAKSTVVRVEGTITDANLRAQRQVARVDGMVSAALTTTQEVADTISNGIRVPAMKIAALMGQAKIAAEGLIAKVKGMGGAPPFGSRRGPQ
jgi:flagellar basal body-associated protein FliL